MGRAWQSDVTSGPDRRESVVTLCPFAEQWRARHGEREGQIYCEEVDPAIRAGYSSDLRFDASRFILRDGGFCVQVDELLAN